MKKIFLTAMIVMMLSLNVLPVNAAIDAGAPFLSSEEEISPASEETVWYNRIYNGMLQKRLWSITYQKWLTDWIDVEPVG